MTDEELAEIRSRVEAATPGPWEAQQDGAEWVIVSTPEPPAEHVVVLRTDTVGWYLSADERQSVAADMEFIAHAHQDILALLAERATLLEIARAVDRIGRDATGALVTASPFITDCPLCHQRITGPVDHEPRHPPLPKLGHRNDCPVLQARASLGEEK